MPEQKTVTYTIEIDKERYASLPYFALARGHPKGSLESTAEILLQTLDHPKEVVDGQWWSFHEGNYRALLAWVEAEDWFGTKQLFSINEPTQNPISWTIKTQIRGIL